MSWIQYVLNDSYGRPVCKTHQDDSETPLIADTLEGLVGDIAEREDVSSSYILHHLDVMTGKIVLGNSTYQIVRQEVTEAPLTPDDLVVLSKEKRQSQEDYDD